MNGVEIKFLNGVATLKFLDNEEIVFEYEKYASPYDLMDAVNTTVEYFINKHSCDLLCDFDKWKSDFKNQIDSWYHELDDRMLKSKLVSRELSLII